jgi:transposase
VIDEILEADKTAPVKQRHTAKRIYERLRDEYGYTGCSSQVRRAVARSKHYSKEVFVPLSHPPGHAQFDFGEATVVIAGVETKAALAVMTLPYSDAYFVSAYPRECTETFQAGHLAAFEFYGGVPVRTSYDNTSIAVKKVVGRERELTTEFLRLESHFLFGHHFCRVGRGNEKGHVETHVGYARRNLLVPVPRFSSFAEMNEYFAGCCYADLFRRVRGKPETKAERLVVDLAAMLALPSEFFEARRVEQRGANSLSLVRCRGRARQSRDTQDPEGPPVAVAPPEVPLPLHADLWVVDEPRRAVVLRAHDEEAAALRPPQRQGPCRGHRGLGRELERGPEALRLAQDRRGDPRAARWLLHGRQ